MIKALVFSILFLPSVLAAQFSNEAVSDSINSGLVALSYDTLIQPYQAFWASGDLYLYLSQISGKQFLALRAEDAITQPGGFNIFRFNETEILRSWHNYEIDNWILGATGTNYEGYTCSTVVVARVCTITISGDTWEGTASSDDNALGLAFYHFLIDPDFATYLQ